MANINIVSTLRFKNKWLESILNYDFIIKTLNIDT